MVFFPSRWMDFVGVHNRVRRQWLLSITWQVIVTVNRRG
jgi:hypothetical protein